jgi:hypothetical protein
MTLTATGPGPQVSANAWDTGPMRAAYVHQGILVMSSEADLDAPGAAVTLALCGSWDHRPPCPLAHHTHSERSGTIVRVRVVFVTQPENEGDVRRRIDAALGTGSVTGPAGTSTHWEVRGSTAAELTVSETARARRLTGA